MANLQSAACSDYFVIIVLNVFNIDYDSYYASADSLSYLLTPATVCLAIPLYQQIEQLKKHKGAIFAGISAGVLTSLCTVWVLSLLFQLTHEEYVPYCQNQLRLPLEWACLKRQVAM